MKAINQKSQRRGVGAGEPSAQGEPGPAGGGQVNAAAPGLVACVLWEPPSPWESPLAEPGWVVRQALGLGAPATASG